MPKNTPDTSAPSAPAALTPQDAKPASAQQARQAEKQQAQLSYEERIFALRTKVAREPGIKLRPEEWRELDCQVQGVNQFGGVKRDGGHRYALHLSAAALHGWDLDAYHAREDDRLLLTREDYEAALKAIDKLQTITIDRKRRSGRVVKGVKVHVPTPHAPAVSKYAPDATKKLAGIKPEATQ